MSTEVFRHLFPPPRFMRMPAAGLDISDKVIRFVRLPDRHKKGSVENHGLLPIPSGAVVYGDIIDIEKVRTEIRRLRTDHGIRYVRLALPEKKAFTVDMKIHKVKKKEIRDAIMLQFEDHIPMRPEEMVFDYDFLGYTDNTCTEMDIQVSALPQSTIEQYVDLFRGTGVEPLSFEIEAQAVSRCVIPKGDSDTYMIVDVGRLRTGIYIVVDGVIRFSSNIDIGGETLTRDIAQAKSIEEKEAETIKESIDFSFLESKKGKEERVVAQDFLASVQNEIQKRLHYWHGHKNEKTEKAQDIAGVILCGSQSSLYGFGTRLGRSLGVDVEHANVWKNVFDLDDYIPEITKKESLSYATAIGMALIERQI